MAEAPAGCTSLFGTPAFLDLWWHHFGPGDAARIPGLDDPYLRQVFYQRRLAPGLRAWTAAGDGVTDFLDLDWQHTTPAACEQLLERFATGRHAPLLVFPRLTEDARLTQLLNTWAQRHGVPLHQIPYEDAPYVDLTRPWAEVEGQHSSKSRSTLRRKARRLGDMGGLTFAHHTTPDAVRTHLPTAFALYEKRAEVIFRGPLWLTENGRAFLETWALRFAEMGHFELTLMHVGETPLAFCYAFPMQGIYAYYAVAFDPDPAYAKYSPGLVLVQHLVERAHESGMRCFDFLVGDEPYKHKWATDARTVATYLVARPDWQGRLALRAYLRLLRTRQAIRTSETLRPLAEKAIQWLRR